ncbi:GNAT family N-acetyltransferase [Nocardia sp. NPDC052001]|uniref:GNAT family N-acetyltransferase n=1 Tax=Nocardia sp. NPDC052001 TaxID=3154853 RepID=UPI00341C994C
MVKVPEGALPAPPQSYGRHGMDEVISGLVVRAARPNEAGLLSELTVRSKAVWGYGDDFLAQVREQLRIRPEEVLVRRVVVAEYEGRAVGVATLEGEPPEGEFGLLFVEPELLRCGVGRVLYEHMLTRAGILGFTVVNVAADRHAVPFYRAMGAERSQVADAADLVGFQVYPISPEPSWVRAWNGGTRPVMVGNVAEFHGQFTGVRAEPDHYSCLAAFCGPEPAKVLLPLPVADWWREHVAETLGWDELAVGTPAERGIGPGVRPWGWTSSWVPQHCELLRAVHHFESKRHANALFHELAGQCRGIVVPAQRSLRSARALHKELAEGGRVVLKREYGAGGSGTMIVSRETPGLYRLLREWSRTGVLVEEYIDGVSTGRDVTFDAVIDAQGWVYPVGVAEMDVAGTAYMGATVGPGVVPPDLDRTASRFAMMVGRVLSGWGYRGWFDVDFVVTAAGALAPMEINLRLTGPAVTFHIRNTLDRLHGGRHFVRTLDCLRIGARLPDPALRAHVGGLVESCRALGVTLLVTIPTAAFDPAPYLGIALAGRSLEAIGAAEAEVNRRNSDLWRVVSARIPQNPTGFSDDVVH